MSASKSITAQYLLGILDALNYMNYTLRTTIGSKPGAAQFVESTFSFGVPASWKFRLSLILAENDGAPILSESLQGPDDELLIPMVYVFAFTMPLRLILFSGCLRLCRARPDGISVGARVECANAQSVRAAYRPREFHGLSVRPQTRSRGTPRLLSIEC